MKTLLKFSLVAISFANLLLNAQTPCSQYLNDFIPKTTDSVLEINVNFILFSKPGGGVWDNNDITKADQVISSLNVMYGNIAAPHKTVTGVNWIQHSKIKFVRKNFAKVVDTSGYFYGYDPQYQTPFEDTNALNIIYYYSGLPGAAPTVPSNRATFATTVASQINETARIEILKHEIGHALGLDHSTAFSFFEGGLQVVGDGPTHVFTSQGCCAVLTATDYVLEDSVIFTPDCSNINTFK